MWSMAEMDFSDLQEVELLDTKHSGLNDPEKQTRLRSHFKLQSQEETGK